MTDLQFVIDRFLSADLLPIAITLPTAVLLLAGIRAFLRRDEEGEGSSVSTQATMLVLTLIALVAIVLALPIHNSSKHDVLNLVAVLGSGAIALSSTTLLSNILAGLMLRSVRNFKLGDFLRCGEHFGRVTERGLVHTEIQTEDRDLTTLPNLFLIQNPVTVVRASGTILSTKVSLGYDGPRNVIESALTDAARAADLADPYVHILELGDFSVTYRVAGLLQDVRQLLSARSRLNTKVLDHLHMAGAEIVSPTYMNTRAYKPETKVLPVETPVETEQAPKGSSVEALAFDKADVAQSIEDLKKTVAALGAERDTLLEQSKTATDPAEKERLKESMAAIGLRIDRMGKVISGRKDDLKAHDDESVS